MKRLRRLAKEHVGNREQDEESQIDVDALLRASANENNQYLLNKSPNDIAKEVIDALIRYSIPDELLVGLSMKLTAYRYVDEIHHLHLNKQVRWIRKPEFCREQTPELVRGGFMADISIRATGIMVIVRSFNNIYITFNFNECITFQRMGDDELLILYAQQKHFHR